MEFSLYRLGDIITLYNGRAYLMPELQSSGKYRIVRVGNFSGKDEWFYSDMELESEKYCEKGDLLYKWACNFGPEIWKDEKTIYHYHIWKLSCDERYIDKMFAFYYLQYITPLWLGGTNGTTMVHITKTSMEKKKLILPQSVDIQKKIARIINAYDDLIENNNKRIKILEKMAENLYKEWFVRFRFPGHESVEFENGLPQGWMVEKLGNLCEIITGKKDANEVVGVGKYPFFTCARETSLFTDEYILDANAILIAGNGSYTGFVKKHSGRFDLYQRTYALYNFKNIEWLYLYWVIKINFEREFMGGSRGSAIPYITRPNIFNYKVLVPTKDLLIKAQEFFNKVHNECVRLHKANENLIKQRDMLLPRLMSGKLEVKEKQEKVLEFKPKKTFVEFKNEFKAAARKDGGLTEQDLQELYRVYCDDSIDE